MKKMMCVLILLLSKSITYSQCDESLSPSDNPSIAYKFRGNRCEGTYTAHVGAPSMGIAGFTIGVLSYRLEKNETIEIKNGRAFPIFIRSTALPINSYYRMDATLDSNRILKWEIKEIIFDLKIPSKSLGVFGWFGSEQEKTYVPVQPVSSIYQEADKRLYLIVRPSTRVRGAKYRYALAGQRFGEYQDIKNSGNARETLTIVLPDHLKGVYTMEVAAMYEFEDKWVVKQYKLFIQ
jgi:hypothetical protein